MIKEKFIEITLAILLILLVFIIFISIRVNNPVEENKISRVPFSVRVYDMRINNVLSMMEKQFYDGVDFKFIFDVNGEKKEVDFHDNVYEILENDVLIDVVKKEDGQDIIKEISYNIPFKVRLNIKYEDDKYIALGPVIEGNKPEEAYKITVDKDGNYIKVTENSDLISLEFK